MVSEKQEIGLSIFWLQISICKGDSSYVLHGSNSKLRAKDLVIFLPWELDPCVGLIKLDSDLNHSEQLGSIDVVFLTISEEDSHWDLALFILVFDHIKLTSTHVVNVSGNGRALFELVMPKFLAIFNQILEIS